MPGHWVWIKNAWSPHKPATQLFLPKHSYVSVAPSALSRVVLEHSCSDAANLSYAALQLNDDLQFSHSVYGFGSGAYALHSRDGFYMNYAPIVS